MKTIPRPPDQRILLCGVYQISTNFRNRENFIGENFVDGKGEITNLKKIHIYKIVCGYLNSCISSSSLLFINS